MLNDFIITRDAVGFLQHYLRSEGFALPDYEARLATLAQQQQMSFEQWWNLLSELDVLLDRPALGLDIGRTIQVEQCGVLGYLFRTSRDLGEALNCFRRFERLLYAGSTVRTVSTDGTVALVWQPEYGYSSQLSDELLLAAIVNISREIIKPYSLNPAYVAFTQGIEESERETYQTFFRCPITTHQERLTLAFTVADLQHHIPHEDQTLHDLLGQQAEQLLTQLPESDIFLAKLRNAIIRCLHEGCPDAATVASQLGMSQRTLHRRLKEKGREFRHILRDVRKSMAQRYLTDPQLTLAETALLLGYTDQSAFSRAFRVWFGQTPAQYRSAICHD